MEKSQDGFKIIFDGKIEALNSEIIIANLSNTVNILQEVNREIKGPQLEIYIKPFAPGSFEISYQLLYLAGISGIIGQTSLEMLKYILSIVVDLFKLKKHLKGKAPEDIKSEGKKVKIKNSYGNIINVDQRTYILYKNNDNINDSLVEIFSDLEVDENIESVTVTDRKDKKLFLAERTDFKGMREKNELIQEDIKEKIERNIKLVLYRIVFAEDRKWAFVYNETIISSYISDEAFFKNFNGYRFGKGDYFIADLKIIKIYDETAGVYINKNYEVIKIHDIKRREEQSNFKFESEED